MSAAKRYPAYAVEILEKQAALSARVESMSRTLDEHKRDADTFDGKLDDLRDQVAGLVRLDKRVENVEKVGADYLRMKHRGIGAWLLVTVLGTAFGGAVLKKFGWG